MKDAIGNGGDESERASHVINNLQKYHTSEFKSCLADRAYVTISIKKMQPVEVLSMMDEANMNPTQI